MTTTTDELMIAAPHVPRFRAALKRELGAKLDILGLQLDAHLTPKQWNTALASFIAGCELLRWSALPTTRRRRTLDLTCAAGRGLCSKSWKLSIKTGCGASGTPRPMGSTRS